MPQVFAPRDEPVGVLELALLLVVSGRPEREVALALLDVDLLGVGAGTRRGESNLVFGRT
jgi:hypothetical protein